MNCLKWSASLLLILLIGCGRHDESSMRQAIGAQSKIFERAVNTMNVSGVMSVYWESPELIAMYPGGNYRGYDDVKQSWWDFFNSTEVKKFEFTETHIEASGDRAYEWGTFTFVFQPRNGPVVNEPGRYLVVWRYIGKEWVIVADHASFPKRSPLPDTTRQ